MLGRILRYLAVAFCIAFVSSCMADEDSLLMDGDVPCTVKVAGIVADGTVMTPLSSVDVRLELYAPGASSAHSSVSTRTDDSGRYELEVVYDNTGDRCFVTVPACSHLGIRYKEYKVEVILFKDSTGYDEVTSTFKVGNLPIVLTRE
ncbi:MAG: hypothetical protein SPK38_07580 [Candidatus Cryptobacteroides sp.]|nr:hypothetical protein [Candidatus Cryptobacteroides sp.]